MTEARRARRMILLGSAAIVLVAVVATGTMFGAYALALAALHNHSDLSVAQACQHWQWIYSATARDHTPALHAAVGKILTVQLRCPL
jgi:hypothetical protein